MRHNQKLSVSELHSEAVAAFENAQEGAREEGRRFSQRSLAEDLGVTSGAMSRALKEPSTTFAKLQTAIIQHLTGYEIEEEIPPPVYRVKRSGHE